MTPRKAAPPAPLPTSTANQETGHEAYRLFQGLRVFQPLIIKRADSMNDFGVDATLNICSFDSNQGKWVTGRELDVQIKGTMTGVGPVPVLRTTWLHWVELAVPVLVLLIDVMQGHMYWSTPWLQLPNKSAKEVGVPFVSTRLLVDGAVLDPLGRLPAAQSSNLWDVLETFDRCQPGRTRVLELMRQTGFLRGHADPVDDPGSTADFESFYNHATALDLMLTGELSRSLEDRWPVEARKVENPPGDDEWTWGMRDSVLRNLLPRYLRALDLLRSQLKNSALPVGDEILGLLTDLGLAQIRNAVTLELFCHHAGAVDLDDPFGLEASGPAELKECCLISSPIGTRTSAPPQIKKRFRDFWKADVYATAWEQNK